MDVFDLGVGLASREGGGGSGAGDFSLRTDFRESGVGGGTGFGGGSSALVGGGSAAVGGWEKMEGRVGEGRVVGRGRFGNGGVGGTGAGGFGGEGMGGLRCTSMSSSDIAS